MLIAARSSHDFACCAPATASARLSLAGGLCALDFVSRRRAAPSHSIDRILKLSCCLHQVMWASPHFSTTQRIASTVVTSSWISYEKPRSQNLLLPFVPSKNRFDRCPTQWNLEPRSCIAV